MTTDITISLDDSEVTALARIHPDGIEICLSNDGYNPEVIALVTKALAAVQPRYVPQPGHLFRANGTDSVYRAINPNSTLIQAMQETGHSVDFGFVLAVDHLGWYEEFDPKADTFERVEIV